ncbi:MAG TPA: N-acetylmuramic acid 6-phosphate etherase [Candidatus Bathyarchaeota archaeon]|nr:N-acetylmuramic acid 6-phosphate etherase [Candidatus Bathyarchaeota archaeon]
MEDKETFKELSGTVTEKENPKSRNISQLATIEILRIINSEDKKVAYAVEREIEKIAEAVETILEAVKKGGRWIYVGAGTSGRLGIIDAAELLPTFKVGPEMVEAIIAGGPGAVFRPIEKAEDDEEMAIRELKARRIDGRDVVIGISASGRTPYVVSALKYAKRAGAKTIAITSNRTSRITKYADIVIAPETGPEVITGSTRMKAATAQKMILTMLSTTVMIKMGRVKGNLMITLEPVSRKLMERAKMIIMRETGKNYEEAGELLERADGNLTLAIVMAKTGLGRKKAERILREAGNIPIKAIELAEKMKNEKGKDGTG